MSLNEDCWSIVVSKLSIREYLNITQVNKMLNSICNRTKIPNDDIIEVKYNIVIPDSVLTIGINAFSQSLSLQSITLSMNLVKIEQMAFHHCTSLQSIVIPNSVTTIASSVFDGCISLTSVTLGSNVQKLGAFVFRGCGVLPSIVIPDSVDAIDVQSFSGCYSLSSIVQPFSCMHLNH